MCAFGFDHECELSRASKQTMFSCTLLHGTNPVIAPRINMRTALSKSDCSILHLFQCWSSLRCQRNPVLASARNLLCISLPSRWQGRYGSCQCIPLSPSPCLLLGESWRHFQRYGCPVAFWEMQSFVNDRRMAKWSEQHWNHVTECHLGTTSCNNNAVLCIFVPLLPLSILPLSLSLLFISRSFFFYEPGIWKRLEWLSWDRRRRLWAASKH